MSRRARSDNRQGVLRAEEWMVRALAATAGTHPHPNPRVGAVVIDDGGSLVAECVHERPGAAHAEAAAVALAGERARGSTVFVTLEPCNHFGRTAPCTDALIEAGVARVVVGVADPDVRVSGDGIARLRAAGIHVVVGVISDEIEVADRAYFHHRRTGRPLVTLKAAATLDGQVAAADGTSQWITSADAREDGHRLRAAADAVVVGAGTLRVDDPRLTVRFEGYEGPQPVPVIVAGNRPLPAQARLYERNPLVYAAQPHPELPFGEVVVAWSPGGVDLTVMMKDLADRGILGVLVEGGPTLAASLLQAGLVDRMVLYIAARLGGGQGLGIFDAVFSTLEASRPVTIESVRRVGPDIRIEVALDDAGGS